MPKSVYEEQLEAAERLFDDEKECIRLAKHNLADPTIPPYYVFQNLLLISSATEGWDGAEIWMRAARQSYHTFHIEASRRQNTAALVNQFLEEDLTEILDQKREEMVYTPPDERQSFFWEGTASDFGVEDKDDEEDEDEGDKDDKDHKEDEQDVAKGTETIVLPIRNLSASHAKGKMPGPAIPNPTANAVRKTAAAPTKSYLRDTASFATKKRGLQEETTDNTHPQEQAKSRAAQGREKSRVVQCRAKSRVDV
ncbi:hypothetical protein M3J07_004607 [Ascochyta lentis]